MNAPIFQLVMMNPIYRFLRKSRVAEFVLNFFEARGFFRRSIAKDEIKRLLGKEEPIIVEVGANNGCDTIEFLQTFEKIKIYCFEPDPRALEEFKSRIRDPRCELFEVAVSDKNGEQIFHLSDGRNSSNQRYIGSSSLKKPFKHLVAFPEVVFNDSIKVKTLTLDEWSERKKIQNIDLVWADVQGAERELIMGGCETFARKVRYFYTEFSNNELYKDQPTLNEILQLLPGYTVFKIYTSNILLKNSQLADPSGILGGM